MSSQNSEGKEGMHRYDDSPLLPSDDDSLKEREHVLASVDRDENCEEDEWNIQYGVSSGAGPRDSPYDDDPFAAFQDSSTTIGLRSVGHFAETRESSPDRAASLTSRSADGAIAT